MNPRSVKLGVVVGQEQDDFPTLMQRVLAGEERAAEELLDRFGPAVLQAVRKRLGRHLRSKFDSLDFVQDVWGSFFASPPTGDALTSPVQFVHRLTRIAQNKVIDAARRRPEARSAIGRREQSLEHSAAEAAAQLQTDDATPSQHFVEREEWELLLKEQPPVYRRILILLRSGFTVREVALELNIHPRRIQRFITKLVSRLRA